MYRIIYMHFYIIATRHALQPFATCDCGLCLICFDMFLFMVPFRSSGHGDGRLDQAGAEDLFHVAFFRGQGLLADHRLCSVHSFSSVDSVRRAQVLAHQSLHDGMCKRLRSTLARAGRTSTIVIKRLWDETSLRVQLSLTDLKRVLGEDVANVADDVKRRSRGGRGSIYPGYVVQSMQQKAYI